jgi:hypothetical protein
VRREWGRAGEADRWKLMRFRGQHDFAAALPFALASLDSKADDIVAQAVRYLGRYKEAKAREPLLKALGAAAPRVRWDALDALTAIGGDGVAEAFTKLLDKDGWAARGEGLHPPDGYPPPWWPDGRPQVIRALGTLKAKAAAPALLTVLREKGPGRGYLGSVIIPLLGEFGHREAIPELCHILATDPGDLAGALDPAETHGHAASALWEFGDPLGRPLLIHYILNRERGTGLVVWEALGRCADRRDFWVLAHCLEPPGGESRKLACQILERLTGITNRAPGWAAVTEHDAPLWRAWYEKHRPELARIPVERPRRARAEAPPAGSLPTLPGLQTEARPLSPEAAEAAWARLASPQYAEAFRAMLDLLRAPEDAVRLCARKLRPVRPADPQRIRGLTARLDAPAFSVREAAAR